MLCGEKEETSKVPSWRCFTGIPRGSSSDVSVCANVVSAVVIRDSGRWKEGEREDIMLGVRRRTDAFSRDCWLR